MTKCIDPALVPGSAARRYQTRLDGGPTGSPATADPLAEIHAAAVSLETFRAALLPESPADRSSCPSEQELCRLDSPLLSTPPSTT